MFSRFFGHRTVKEAIWFSRDVQQGLLRRWMVIVHSARIIFLRQPDGSYKFEVDQTEAWTPQGECDRLDSEGRVVVNPFEDRHTLVRVAYTRYSRLKASECLDAVRSHFPAKFSWTQCQDFLRQFVTRVMDRPDNEWMWFLDNTDTARQNLQQLPPPPAHLVRAYLAQQQKGQDYATPVRAARLSKEVGMGMDVQQQKNMLISQQFLQNSYNYPGYGHGS